MMVLKTVKSKAKIFGIWKPQRENRLPMPARIPMLYF